MRGLKRGWERWVEGVKGRTVMGRTRMRKEEREWRNFQEIEAERMVKSLMKKRRRTYGKGLEEGIDSVKEEGG